MCVTQFDTVRNYISRCHLRMDSIPALDNPYANQEQKFKQSTVKHVNQKNTQCNTQLPQKHSELSTVDVVSSNVNSSHTGPLLYIFEDDEAVIKMTTKGRSPTRRNVSRTQRVAIDRLFDIFLDPKIRIRYMDSKNHTRRHVDQGTLHSMEPSYVFIRYKPCQLSELLCVQFSKLLWGRGEKTTGRWWKGRREIKVNWKFGIEELYGAINDAIFDGIFKPGEIRIRRSRNEVWNKNGETQFQQSKRKPYWARPKDELPREAPGYQIESNTEVAHGTGTEPDIWKSYSLHRSPCAYYWNLGCWHWLGNEKRLRHHLPCNTIDSDSEENLGKKAQIHEFEENLGFMVFSFMPLNIDVKMIRSSNFSRSMFLRFTCSWHTRSNSNDVSLGRVFHSNSSGSPSIP